MSNDQELKKMLAEGNDIEQGIVKALTEAIVEDIDKDILRRMVLRSYISVEEALFHRKQHGVQ